MKYETEFDELKMTPEMWKEMKNVLKDCPLCGGQDLRIRLDDKGCKSVTCRRCGISMVDEHGHADARWNGLGSYLLDTALMIIKAKVNYAAERLLRDIAEIEGDLKTRRPADAEEV